MDLDAVEQDKVFPLPGRGGFHQVQQKLRRVLVREPGDEVSRRVVAKCNKPGLDRRELLWSPAGDKTVVVLPASLDLEAAILERSGAGLQPSRRSGAVTLAHGPLCLNLRHALVESGDEGEDILRVVNRQQPLAEQVQVPRRGDGGLGFRHGQWLLLGVVVWEMIQECALRR